MDLIKRINESAGLNLSVLKALQTRKGLAFKVEESGIEMILKSIELKDNDIDQMNRKRSLQREAQILKDFQKYACSHYVSSGIIDHHFWLLRKWIKGKTSFEHTSYIRDNPKTIENKKKFSKDLSRMLRKVIQFFELGYLHGDLQAGHFIFDKDEIYLIDLELSVNIYDPNPYYRGALVHFVPPETALEMRKGNDRIPLDQTSEIYSFGAVAFFLYTGEPPVEYKNRSFKQRLQAISQGEIRTFAQVGAEPFPQLEEILLRCLESNKMRRYQTFNDLLRVLSNI